MLTLVTFFLALTAVVLVLLEQRRARARDLRLNKKLDLVLRQTGLHFPDDLELAPVRELLRKGRTVAAIRLYRELTGVDLAEAAEAVAGLRTANIQ